MNEALVAGLVAVAIGLVEIVKASFKKFGKNGKNGSVLTEEERTWVRELHEWHAKEDSDGVKIWYIRQSLANAIAAVATSVNAQTRALEAIFTKLEAIDDKVDAMKPD